MDIEEYRSFIARLQQNLEADPRVLGLVAVGSMAQRETRPDEWSDHDFWVIVQAGVQEEIRNHVAWIPDWQRLVYRFRETAHGVKALFDTGHLLEFAVFDLDELYLTKIDQYRILFDRADVARRLDEIGRSTSEGIQSAAQDDAYLIGQVLTGVLVAYGRWFRGERLSTRSFLVGVAMPHLVRLLAKYVPPEAPGTPVSVDPLRRFERGHAALGAELDEILARPAPAASAGLLELVQRELAARMPQFPEAALAAVRRRMA